MDIMSFAFVIAVGAGSGALMLFSFKDPATKGKKAALLVTVLGIIAAPLSLGYLAHCPTLQIAGVNVR